VFNASYTDPAGILTSGTATYTVKDYEGNIVLEETQSFVGNADVFTIEKGGIPFGIYTLEVALSGDNVEQREVYDFSYALRAPESNMHFGTNVHFDWHEAFTTDDVDAQLELIKASGYGFVRTKTEWMDVDPDGDGNFRPHEIYWHGNQKADELGLEILAIIGQGHPAYDYFPYFLDSEELQAKYAEACTYIVSELKQYTDYYTNPNEMNIFYPDGWDKNTQGSNAKYFAAYSKAANDAIHAEHPGAKIISGAVAGPDLDWTEELYQLNLLDYTEGFSFHHYNYRQGPEGSAKNSFSAARELTDEYSTTDETWVTENGWPTLNYDDIAVAYGRATEYEQAKWYARSFSIFSDPAIADKYFHYCFPNTNVGYFWQEDNFGIVRSHDYKTPYAAKPAYIATTAFHTIVGDATFYGDQNTTDGKYYDYKFVNDAGETIMVLWREDDVANKTYTFSTAKPKVEIYDMYGNKTVQNVSGGSVSLTMTDAPIYVKAID
ncbi:MAG: hypothetical protein IJO50_01360, partial [Clostridia bacterium]|nr:hypothetical protein [Clostridia bacterium]